MSTLSSTKNFSLMNVEVSEVLKCRISSVISRYGAFIQTNCARKSDTSSV